MQRVILLGEAVLAVLVPNGTHNEVDTERRKAEGASEGRAAAEVVLRGAVEVLEGQVRLWCMRRNGKCRTGTEHGQV